MQSYGLRLGNGRRRLNGIGIMLDAILNNNAILLGERNNGSIIASVLPAPVADLTTTCLDESKEMGHLS